MTEPDSFDLVVLGGGTGGYSCALRAADLGMSVALIERDKVGGTCLHRGCIPAKALLQAAEVATFAADAAFYGVKARFDGVDPAALVAYKQRIVDTNHRGLQATLRTRGVQVITGTGRLVDPRTVAVADGRDERRVRAGRALVLATGSVPRALPVPGAEIDGVHVISSDHALDLDRIPQAPIIIGASAVGLEFATAWHAYGSTSVTLVEALPTVAPREDEDTSTALAKELTRQGMHRGSRSVPAHRRRRDRRRTGRGRAAGPRGRRTRRRGGPAAGSRRPPPGQRRHGLGGGRRPS